MDARLGAGSRQGNVEAAGKSVVTKLEGPKSEGAKSDGPKSDGPKSDGPWTVRKLLGWIAGFLKDREVDDEADADTMVILWHQEREATTQGADAGAMLRQWR
jgi:hypothetical protein